jgi:hypothetical protein
MDDLRDHPLVKALVAELPAPGSVWPIDERLRWLRAFSSAVAFLRGDLDEIRIEKISEWPFLKPIIVSQPPAPNGAAEHPAGLQIYHQNT